MQKKRNYGIELLRLVLMFMVCILHTLGRGGILNASAEGTIEYKVFWFLEILSYCAVNGFALISGYTASNRPRKYERIVEMWIQVFFYSFVLSVILIVAGFGNFDLGSLIKFAFPVTFNVFWYFTAYFALFFASPILNKFIFSVSEEDSKKATILFILFFSIMGVLADPFESQNGYSAIWIIALYCIGAFAKQIKLFENQKTITLLIMWAICIFGTWASLVFLGNHRLINYISPTILLSAMIMVVLFSRIHLKGNVISKISPLAFGIYLFQLNPIIWNHILKGAFVFVAKTDIIKGVLFVFVFALAIFVLGIIVELLRSKLANILKINVISKKIVEVADKSIGLLGNLLK